MGERGEGSETEGQKTHLGPLARSIEGVSQTWSACFQTQAGAGRPSSRVFHVSFLEVSPREMIPDMLKQEVFSKDYFKNSCFGLLEVVLGSALKG